MSVDSESADKETLRSLLRDIRQRVGIRQSDLAERLGLPQSFVSKYESGERRLDILELRLVCQALGLSMSQFVQELEKTLEGSNEA
jgi:transcriptional regulator with XRE-family HTH domain